MSEISSLKEKRYIVIKLVLLFVGGGTLGGVRGVLGSFQGVHPHGNPAGTNL